MHEANPPGAACVHDEPKDSTVLVPLERQAITLERELVLDGGRQRDRVPTAPLHLQFPRDERDTVVGAERFAIEGAREGLQAITALRTADLPLGLEAPMVSSLATRLQITRQ
ncbi:MAG: hypothetical protein JSV86_14710 [Gemmatimonadota bacterium]|nr:MAG: hypothetical protein JSV86_14710 [Gemmatimonadota bacterium]